MGLAIGETTAEEIKLEIGCATPLMTEKSMEVRGRDLTNGLPRNVIVTSSQMQEAMQDSINEIVERNEDINRDMDEFIRVVSENR